MGGLKETMAYSINFVSLTVTLFFCFVPNIYEWFVDLGLCYLENNCLRKSSFYKKKQSKMVVYY